MKRVQELIALGRMQPSGIRAFESRDAQRAAGYSYEERPHRLDADSERQFQEDARAWEFFTSQPWYRRTSIWWVVSAKREDPSPAIVGAHPELGRSHVDRSARASLPRPQGITGRADRKAIERISQTSETPNPPCARLVTAPASLLLAPVAIASGAAHYSKLPVE